MDGTFLSRYNNRIDEWSLRIKNDPVNRKVYESEMAEYIMKCLPFMNQYADESTDISTSDNVFNARETAGLKRKDIYTDYLINVENKKNLPRSTGHLYTTPECKTCLQSNILYFRNTHDSVCDGCGAIIDNAQPSGFNEEIGFKEQQSYERIIHYSYKRENHFNEWLSQFQAQEMTNIPDEVMDQLRDELKKIKIKKLEDITHAKVRGLLKKLRLNKYYEHVPYITNILNGIKAPNMPQELEEYLRIMFKDIQKPFDANCPTERKNFLSYSYVLYKFCELLDKDEYLQYFPLLKSKEKLYQQDVIWKKICHDLKWEFIPTI